MKNLILAIFVAIAAVSATFAQAGNDEYRKAEGYVGYSYSRVSGGIDFDDEELGTSAGFNGFNASGVYNFSRYVGVKADFSAAYNSETFSSSSFLEGAGGPTTVSFKSSNSLYNITGGIQVKDNSKSGRFKPFAHALVGAGIFRTSISDFTCTPASSCSPTPVDNASFNETGLSGVFGGGIDIRVNDRFQIRVIQVDYNPVRIEGTTLNNVRIGAGIVF